MRVSKTLKYSGLVLGFVIIMTPALAVDPLDRTIQGSIELLSRPGEVTSEGMHILFLKKYFNPAAKPELLRQMEISAQRKHLIQNFGYVAELEDLPWYENFFSDKNRIYDYTTIYAASALGIMSRRGMSGADDLLDKILSPYFWKGKKIDSNDMPHRIKSGGLPEHEMFICIAYIKSKTNDPRRYEKIALALDNIEDEKMRNDIVSTTKMAECVSSIPRYKTLSQNYMKEIQHARDLRISKINRKMQQDAEAMKTGNEKRKQENAARERRTSILDILENCNHFILNQMPADESKNLVAEAIQCLNTKIKPWIEKPNDKQLRNEFLLSAAEDAVPFFCALNMQNSRNMDTWIAGKRDVSKGIVEMHEVATILFQKDLDLERARILSYSMDKIDQAKGEEIRKDPKSKADMIIVIIPVKNGEDLKAKFPKYFKRSGPFSPLITLDENGTPLIHVIYHRDMKKWFWNPPGW